MIVANKATLDQLRTVYDVADLYDMHDAIDYEIEIAEARQPA